MVYIVGIGPGSREYVLPKAVEIMEKSDIIVGFERAIKSIKFISTDKVNVKTLKDILNIINKDSKKNIAVVASGDPCYYGITNYIKNNYVGDIDIIPGISSFQYMMCRLKKTWNTAFTGSMHGREEDFICEVKRNKLSIWLTDKTNSPSELCKRLVEENIKAVVYVGENLSYEDEKITCGQADEMIDKEYSELCVVVIEK
ncbi:precorrin-6y C5,15-methyltransferase (decarboxylating) subunit CbiE [Haloimpatiens sp. FM7330]|uniref:precorrin-6y C5,15-methyltransferase (decarboxylating) subunit CbiE n=1 Tax=Haloimpatiens sp. FM7330 TaxID=3298610 RepID=UPI003636E160